MTNRPETGLAPMIARGQCREEFDEWEMLQKRGGGTIGVPAARGQDRSGEILSGISATAIAAW